MRKPASSRSRVHVTVPAIACPFVPSAARFYAPQPVNLFTIGHGTRPLHELLETLHDGGVRTLVDVRRFPSSRRNPQFNQQPLAAALEDAEIGYRHAVELGGRRTGEPGEERF